MLLLAHYHEFDWLLLRNYHNIPKYSDIQDIVVIILKFEEWGSTIE